VNLNWTTATEINNDFFTVERSKDGVVFEPIATQKGAGNSTIKINYATIDNAPYNGVSYYRLKQTDLDGKESYSMIRSVNIENGNQVIITHYPNPVNESVKFVFSSTESAIAKYTIYDAIGNIAYEGSIKTIAGSNEFNLAVPALSQGIYILKMNINGMILTDKFMKQ
jgi:hypothetical protein